MMRIRLLCILAIGILELLGPVGARAQFLFTTNNGSLAITGYTGPGGNVVIPSETNGYMVTSIGDYVFDQEGILAFGVTNPIITGVSIPGSITNIGNSAFTGCTALTNVIMMSGVTTIEDDAFSDCTNLSRIVMPNSVTSIGNDTFGDCSRLPFIIIPGSVISIGYDAFGGCASLTNLTIPDSVTTIGRSAFSECSKLTKILIPMSVTNLGGGVFAFCTGLTNLAVDVANPSYTNVVGVLFNKSRTMLVEYPAGKTGSYVIPSTVESIGAQAFQGCISLTAVTIPNSVTSIGDEAFADCFGLPGITIPNGVASLGVGTFLLCTKFTTIAFPNSVTSLEAAECVACSNLSTVTIGSGVSVIAPDAFGQCPKLTAFTVSTANTNYSSSGRVVLNKKATALVLYPEGKSGAYAMPNGVTAIAPQTFDNCAKLTSIQIPNSVTNIGSYAFLECAGLTSLAIPNSVTSLGIYAVQACTNLTSLTIGSGLTNIAATNGIYGFALFTPVFFDCPKLASITVDPHNAFYSSTNGVLFDKIQSTLLQFPEGKTGTFAIPNGVVNVDDEAFQGCAGLKNLIIPNSVTNIGFDTIFDCSGLTNITFGANLADAEEDLFLYDCTNLISVQFMGNAPSYVSLPPDDAHVTIYYQAGTSGWDWFSFFEDVPTVMLNAPNPSGSLEVDINPYDAEQAGAYWQVDGGVLQPGGATVLGLSVGPHTISFGAISGWITPSNQTVMVTSNATASAAGWYAITGPSAFVYTINVDNSLTIIGYDGAGGSVAIPAAINGMTVTSIGDEAFNNFNLLTDLTISGGVTNIGSGAFYLCENLTNVIITSDILNIGEEAFELCGNLTNLEILNGTPAIGDYAFGYCASLGNVSLPVGATAVGNGAFIGCTSLAGVVIPGTVIQIGDEAFSGCENLAGLIISNGVVGIGFDTFDSCQLLTNIVIPDSVTSIGDYAFTACTGLASMAIPAGVTNLGSFVFIDCLGLTNISVDALNPNYTSMDGVVFDHDLTTALAYPDGLAGSYTIPGSVTSIADGAFDDCSQLLNVTIPGGVTNIGNMAFQGCHQIPSITFPSSLIAIGSNAFNSCWALRAVAIPASVANIGDDAFLDCYSLANITVDVLNSAYASAGGVLFDKNFDTLICCPAGFGGSYVIPDNVVTVEDNAFSACDFLTGVIIPNSVASIGSDAFEGCFNLENVSIPGSVTNIGTSAFFFAGITNLTIEYGVTSIADSAFDGCNNLISVTLPDSLTTIGPFAFSFCGDLANITIPGSVNDIGLDAFGECNKLEQIFFGGNAPMVDFEIYDGSSATAYYLPGTSGWGTNFYGLPTALWFQPNPMILSDGNGLGVQNNRFGFTVSWATNTSVVVMACTNLANPVWKPVQTNLLVNGTNYFSDSKWTNYPGRYYRVRTR